MKSKKLGLVGRALLGVASFSSFLNADSNSGNINEVLGELSSRIGIPSFTYTFARSSEGLEFDGGKTCYYDDPNCYILDTDARHISCPPDPQKTWVYWTSSPWGDDLVRDQRKSIFNGECMFPFDIKLKTYSENPEEVFEGPYLDYDLSLIEGNSPYIDEVNIFLTRVDVDDPNIVKEKRDVRYVANHDLCDWGQGYVCVDEPFYAVGSGQVLDRARIDMFYSSDFNQSGKVDLEDYLILKDQYGRDYSDPDNIGTDPDCYSDYADITRDGYVDSADLAKFSNHWIYKNYECDGVQ